MVSYITNNILFMATPHATVKVQTSSSHLWSLISDVSATCMPDENLMAVHSHTDVIG